MLERLEQIGRALPRELVYGLAGERRVARVKAELLARGDKRLDVCAAQIAHLLHLSGVRLQGATCLELGSGWVLSHALVFHLLGARRVICSDLAPLAFPETLKPAIHGAVTSLVRDVLSPFEDHGRLRDRLDALRATPRFDLAALAALGIEYRAPLDLARTPLGEPVDRVFSWSVLEHVPVDDVDPLLANLARDLAPEGVMLHAIHLEDHRDPAAPLAFLAEPGARFDRQAQTERGNRVRRSDWLARFARQGLAAQELYAWRRDPALLPSAIDASVRHEGPDDLRVSHLGVALRLA